ncbi:MAG: peptide chain release factor 2 [bacterium]|nr:peptide chain release factor 2 [bacterium]MBK7187901.1 peptide chain release factor 2 [bacterium]MBK7770589.1 peptide chain release factor 2 [bacterium]MBK9473456.1 peptide chain release factor 2 [bacterium]
MKEIVDRLDAALARLATLKEGLDFDRLQSELRELEAKQAAPGFWNDQEEVGRVVGRIRTLKQWTAPMMAAMARADDLQVFVELAAEAGDEESVAEVGAGVAELEKAVEKIDFQFLLSGEADERGAVLEIHPGAGGTESQDWAQMLLRMYTRYIEASGWKSQTLDLQAGEEAGIKTAVIEIDAPFAFGYLKSETGVHRLVRISPFDAQKRRHTSFASVFVYPLVEDDISVEIDPGDLRVDTYRAQGAGGQHVNKTDSAIRITHEPTGIVVSCQSERSQHRNRESAMTMLKAKLYARAMEERQREKDAVEATKMDIAWGSQIRSYVLQPYTKVKDHRTDFETGNSTGVLDGDLDGFIDAFLRWQGSRNR